MRRREAAEGCAASPPRPPGAILFHQRIRYTGLAGQIAGNGFCPRSYMRGIRLGRKKFADIGRVRKEIAEDAGGVGNGVKEMQSGITRRSPDNCAGQPGTLGQPRKKTMRSIAANLFMNSPFVPRVSD